MHVYDNKSGIRKSFVLLLFSKEYLATVVRLLSCLDGLEVLITTVLINIDLGLGYHRPSDRFFHLLLFLFYCFQFHLLFHYTLFYCVFHLGIEAFHCITLSFLLLMGLDAILNGLTYLLFF